MNVRRVHPEHGQQVIFEGALHHAHDHARVREHTGLFESLVWNPPHVGDVVAPLFVLERFVERQPPGQPAHQPFAHGVGLAGL